MPMDLLNKLGIRPPPLNLRTVKGIGKDLGLFNLNTSTHKNQNYSALKHAALSANTFFEDDQFPCAHASLFYSKATISVEAIRWMRPKEINPHACLVRRTGDEKQVHLGRDVSQGQIGNCWFIAACSVLADFPKLWQAVIPDHREQEMDKHYAGIFHFKFWIMGVWVDVVIDDRLPTVNGQLIFCRSKQGDEFWGPLLEKAYAKLNGSYEALDGGNLTDALVDFTAGVAESADIPIAYPTADEQLELFRLMEKELQFNTLMCAAISVQSRDEMEAIQQNGLIKGHAYGITDVKTIHNNDVPALLSFLGFDSNAIMRLIRLRNPWVTVIFHKAMSSSVSYRWGKKEWNGRFSDGSPEWNQISEQKRSDLGLVFDDDGEFWMAFDDFCAQFTTVSICRIIYTSFIGTILSGGAKSWSENIFKGRWEKPNRAGGCVNNDTFFNNPQFCFDVATEDEEVQISLSQRDNRYLKSTGGEAYLAIGFYLMRIEINRKTRVHLFKEKAGTSIYAATRHVTLRTYLKPGRYCIIPTTFEPGQETEFLIRILTSYDCKARVLESDIPTHKGFCGLVHSGPAAATQCVSTVTIRQVNGLTSNGKSSLPDAFVVIECEEKIAKTCVIRNSADPVFNETAIFYRKDIRAPIKFQVFNSNLVKDTFLGETKIDASQPPNGQTFQFRAPLHSKDNPSLLVPGAIIVEVASYEDLTAV